MAVVAALGLLLFAAALLAGSAVASVGLRRASRSLVAAARAEAEARRWLGEVVQRWNAAADSLPIGATLDRVNRVEGATGPPVIVQARIRRLTANLYTVTVSARVGDSVPTLAFRRVRLLLERPPPTDSAGVSGAVRPLARWSVVDLH
jgi:hypothetical protein